MKLKCTVCKDYVDENEAIRVGIVSYCSDSCVKARQRGTSFRQETAKKTTSPRKRIRKRSGVSAAVRRGVFEADVWRCRYCGKETELLHCHHVIYRSEGGPHVKSNLISLCMEHHDVVHSNKKRWQPICLGIIWLREVCGDATMTIPVLERQLNT